MVDTDQDITCITDEGLPEGAESGCRVTATTAARQLIREIQAEYGAIMFHQSGGCCDGSSPMCYPKDEFHIGSADVKLGTVEGADVFISGPQFQAWKHTQLILDVVPGRGGMFSLDNGREKRFLTRSRLLSAAEQQALDQASP
ncbi:DUF779 domain-containing protein [Martelella mediterranea]|uniref:Acetaldehyde dehydrogenase n=1 Tax=Martelella mediterranea TaxID=293089 RepID=A0A4R3NL58_9HYPH|nr:DUF779 domain-containing protein [Martelella mediterranea]TCT34779.1 hypothetical protein EDC90_103023 [Martelella mediterranea]